VDDLFKGLTVADIHDDTYRNIVSLRVSEDLFDDLTDKPEGWRAAADLEAASKPPTYLSAQPVVDRPFEEADFNNAIGYPFRHWSRTRYSDGSYGVWYGADTLETSIHETVHHWRHGFLQDSDWQDVDGIVVERKVYLVRCDAVLLDFRTKVDTRPALVDPSSYHLTHRVGARIHHDGHPGLISRSARCDGDVHGVFNPRILSSPRHACYLSYRIEDGSVIVERRPGRVVFRIQSSNERQSPQIFAK
jgi:hypothetical protein